VGVIVHCEGGIISMGRGAPKAFDRAGKEVKQFTAGGGQRDSHFQNFVDVVRSGKRGELRCPVSEGFVSAALSHTGNVSYRVGRMLAPGQVKEQLRGDAALAEAYGRMVEHLGANGVRLDQKQPVVGVPLRFDVKTERFIGNDAANAFLTREYRAPFVVPKIA
jgi:hypothetical protein